ncbi:MAG: spore coat protein YlbD [bacterium]|nr:spore coat protein YlbD [bacterium]
MSKETFKMFVRSNPSLLDYVRNGQMTWQRFYEMYDMYGENHSIWNSYIGVNGSSNIASTPASTSGTLGDTSLKELFNMVKKMDLETVRRGVDGLQKAVGLVQDLTATKKVNNYQARPLYQHLED